MCDLKTLEINLIDGIWVCIEKSSCNCIFYKKNYLEHSEISVVSKKAFSMQNSRIQSFVECLEKFHICIVLPMSTAGGPGSQREE